MQDVTADGSHAAIVVSQGKAPEAAWTAPIGTARLFALLFITCGSFVFFYLYKTARDLRDHAEPTLTPWLYPLSVLIGLANAFAGARLASVARDFAGYEQRRASASPGLVGLLIFLGNLALTVLGSITLQSFWVFGMLLFTVPWLLLERQIDAIKRSLPGIQYRGKPHRFTKLQWVALTLGGVLWLVILAGMWEDVVRWRGTALAASVPYRDPQGHFSVTPSRRGWLVVAPGAVADEAELELLGPGLADWAVVHVIEQAGRSLDAVVDFRYDEVSAAYENVVFSEKRELVPGTSTVVSRSSYRGIDAIDGQFVFHVAAFVTEQRSVELIVYSAGREWERDRSGAEELARSLQPATAKESAVDD